jgi:FdhD protein
MPKAVEHILLKGNAIERTATDLSLIREEPLSIRIQGKPYTVVMRTPGEEIAHVAGFCLGEGIVDSPDDFSTLAYCDEDVNVVTVILSPACQIRSSEILLRKGFISQTSCGICGKEIIDDLRQQIPKVEEGEGIGIPLIMESIDRFSDHQPLRNTNKAAHGAVLYGSDGRVLSSAEDVGRHNALDKAAGRLFLDHALDLVSFLVLSSRASYEMIQKAARARIRAVFSLSRPTALAVSLAEDLSMTLACPDGKNGLYVFCGGERLKP